MANTLIKLLNTALNERDRLEELARCWLASRQINDVTIRLRGYPRSMNLFMPLGVCLRIPLRSLI